MINSNQIPGSPAWWRHYIGVISQRRGLPPRFCVVLVCAGVFMQWSCSSSPVPVVSPTGSTDARKSAVTTPPFSTREPERYQATRITSITEANSETSSSTQVLVARDGEKRREVYSAGGTGQIVHLEIPAGRFIVLPASRMYADLGSASQQTGPGKDQGAAVDSPELSPEQLVNESHLPATYEKVGSETLAGRATTKYRVVVLTGADSENETLIWIDDALGMPVRSEMMSRANGRSSKVTMELKDVKLEVDEGLFSWPADYRKVEPRVIFDLTRSEGKLASKPTDK